MSVPQSHFAGISSPCRSIAEARRSAINDVVRQILGSIGAEYEHSYVDKVSGNVRGQGPQGAWLMSGFAVFLTEWFWALSKE